MRLTRAKSYCKTRVQQRSGSCWLGIPSSTARPEREVERNLQGLNPVTGARLEPVYHSATAEDVALAATLAGEAFDIYSKLSGAEKGRFLRHIADGIEAITS